MFTKSVDQIVSVFTKAIKDLETLEQTRTEQNRATQEIIYAGNDLIAQRNQEIKRAQAVREKLLSITAAM